MRERQAERLNFTAAVEVAGSATAEQKQYSLTNAHPALPVSEHVHVSFALHIYCLSPGTLLHSRVQFATILDTHKTKMVCTWWLGVIFREAVLTTLLELVTNFGAQFSSLDEGWPKVHSFCWQIVDFASNYEALTSKIFTGWRTWVGSFISCSFTPLTETSASSLELLWRKTRFSPLS